MVRLVLCRRAVSEVLIQGAPHANRVIIHGRLANGREHYSELPPYGAVGKLEEKQGDEIVGRVTEDGWTVKAKLVDKSSYWLSRSEPGNRTVEYREQALDEIKLQPVYS